MMVKCENKNITTDEFEKEPKNNLHNLFYVSVVDQLTHLILVRKNYLKARAQINLSYC